MKKEGWYAVSAGFKPYAIDQTTSGCQVLMVINNSNQGIAVVPAPRAPAPFTADELFNILSGVFERHGVPGGGVFICRSVWWSSKNIYADPEMQLRVSQVRGLGFDWPEMLQSERSKLDELFSARGIVLQWWGNTQQSG